MSGFCHEALLYESDEVFVRATADFVREGLEKDEPTLVVLDHYKNDRLRASLGIDAVRVHFSDMAEVGRNPSHIIPAWQHFLDAYGNTGLPVRGIGELISAALLPDELAECQRHEALLNLAFDDHNFTLLCPYDTTSLPTSVVEGALSRHEFVVQYGATIKSAPFTGLDSVHQLLADVLPDPPSRVEWWEFELGDLAVVRDFVRANATALGVPLGRVDDFVVATNEVASNSIRHGGGRGKIAIWQLHDRILCEVRDAGRLSDPLVDRTRVSEGTANGRGLWIANRLCDLVQVRSHARGTSVRIHLRLT